MVVLRCHVRYRAEPRAPKKENGGGGGVEECMKE
jgi:hypothetical protein